MYKYKKWFYIHEHIGLIEQVELNVIVHKLMTSRCALIDTFCYASIYVYIDTWSRVCCMDSFLEIGASIMQILYGVLTVQLRKSVSWIANDNT